MTMPDEKVDNGAFISTGTIYNKVVDLEMKFVKLNTIVTMVGLIVTPLISTIISTVVVTAMKG